MDLYAEIILDHYKNPHHRGSLANPTLAEEDANPLCGDKIRMEIELDDQGKIADIAFNGEGCAISQASASMLTDEVMGKSLGEVVQWNNEDIYDMLQVPLSPARVKCALLSFVVLKKAILKYHLSRQ